MRKHDFSISTKVYIINSKSELFFCLSDHINNWNNECTWFQIFMCKQWYISESPSTMMSSSTLSDTVWNFVLRWLFTNDFFRSPLPDTCKYKLPMHLTGSLTVLSIFSHFQNCSCWFCRHWQTNTCYSMDGSSGAWSTKGKELRLCWNRIKGE